MKVHMLILDIELIRSVTHNTKEVGIEEEEEERKKYTLELLKSRSC